MSTLGIVIAREYFTRIKKPSFIILTILMPFLMIGVVCVPILFSAVKDDVQKEVVVIDKTGKYMPLFIEAQKTDSLKSDGYVFIAADKPIGEYRKEEAEVEAVLCINDNLSKNPDACCIYSKGEVQHDLQSYVEDIINKQVHKEKLASYNVPQLEDIIEDMQSDFSIKTVKWTNDGGESVSSGVIASTIGLISAFLIYMFVLVYGAMVMQGVMEEKTNRIVEVIVGSVKPFYLMMGKIIGVMLVGFTQIGVWLAMGLGLSIIAGFTLGASAVDPDTVQQVAIANANAQQQAAIEAVNNGPMAEMYDILSNLPLAEIIIFFLIYFFGGYILYSSFFAAIGASVNSQEDSSQFMMPMIIIMVIALYGAMGSMENTNGPLAFWASLFPLTSPIVMMVRIPLGVPLWQEALSVILLYATSIGFVWIAGRIYRIGILMYGKKPTIKEMIKWMRYK